VVSNKKDGLFNFSARPSSVGVQKIKFAVNARKEGLSDHTGRDWENERFRAWALRLILAGLPHQDDAIEEALASMARPSGLPVCSINSALLADGIKHAKMCMSCHRRAPHILAAGCPNWPREAGEGVVRPAACGCNRSRSSRRTERRRPRRRTSTPGSTIR
jgi:hypothetical protein